MMESFVLNCYYQTTVAKWSCKRQKHFRFCNVCESNFLLRGRVGAATDLFSVVMNERTQENGLKLCQGKFRLDNKKRFFTQKEQTPQGNAHKTKTERVQEAFWHHSGAHIVILGMSSAGPGDELNDPCGSFPLSLLCGVIYWIRRSLDKQNAQKKHLEKLYLLLEMGESRILCSLWFPCEVW